MKRNLRDLIKHYTNELENEPNQESKELIESTLRELRGKRSLIEFLNTVDSLGSGKKFCWRYCMRVIDSCEVCEYCLSPDDLADNGDE